MNNTLEAKVEVKPSSTSVNYKTKLVFIDINRKHEAIISVVAPSIAQAGMLQFLLEDRLVSFPLNVIFRMETEQLTTVESSKLIVGIEDK